MMRMSSKVYFMFTREREREIVRRMWKGDSFSETRCNPWKSGDVWTKAPSHQLPFEIWFINQDFHSSLLCSFFLFPLSIHTVPLLTMWSLKHTLYWIFGLRRIEKSMNMKISVLTLTGILLHLNSCWESTCFHDKRHESSLSHCFKSEFV